VPTGYGHDLLADGIELDAGSVPLSIFRQWSAGVLAAEEGGGNIPKHAVESCVGGESFTTSTMVLLASGKAVPISQLKAGHYGALCCAKAMRRVWPAALRSALVLMEAIRLADGNAKTGARAAVAPSSWRPQSRGGQLDAGQCLHGVAVGLAGARSGYVETGSGF
jgi:hypothetical protein